MDPKVIEQVLDELFPALEALESQSAAILQFLKEKGMANDEQLAPYLEQAGNASNVRWRVSRLRVMSLLSSAIKDAQTSEAKRGKTRGRTSRAPAGKARRALPAITKQSLNSHRLPRLSRKGPLRKGQSRKNLQRQPRPNPQRKHRTRRKVDLPSRTVLERRTRKRVHRPAPIKPVPNLSKLVAQQQTPKRTRR